MKKRRGSILIFTLWVLIILSIFSIILSRRASSDVKLAKYESRNIKAIYLTKAGVMKMLAELANDRNSYDSLNEDWNRTEENPKELAIRKDRILYGALDEMARLNLNATDLNPQYLVDLGLDHTIVDAIVVYKDAKDNKRFEFIEELFLVKGMTREAFSLMEDSVTIYRKDNAKVNINTARESVLHAIAGSLTQDILDYRRGSDSEAGTDDDGIFTTSSDITNNIPGLNPALFSWQSNIFRIWAKAVLSEDKESSMTTEAVIDRTSGKIYHWKEY